MDYQSNNNNLQTAEELNIRVARRVWDEVWHKGDFSAMARLALQDLGEFISGQAGSVT